MEIIGVCGGSCSGKSTLVKELLSNLPSSSLIHFDDFFVGKNTLVGKTITNWEDPALYRIAELENSLKLLKQNKSVEIIANSRESRHEGITSRIVKPSKYLLVEGFLIFHTPELRKIFDKKIYLDITEEEIIRRRNERMNSGGGQYSEDYINNVLIAEHRKNVVPQKQYADLVVDALKPIEVIKFEVLNYIVK